MSIFDAYDSEYGALSRDIIKNISELKQLSSDNKEKSSNLIRHIDALLIQAADLIKQMEIEVRSHDAGTRKALNEKVSEYKKSLLSLRNDYDRTKEKSQRSSLIGDKSIEQRERLLKTNDKLAIQNELILNATRTVAETEEVGMEITKELARNREKIESSRARAREFSGITDSARRLLSVMQRREVQQKMMLGGLAVVLIIAIAVTAYYSTHKK
mmetsp:Transcript_7367/g.6604  ORF Transcript_7367/g.6604 Transcript_7367/m.6604 type:complete len:214 (+) Transcript_7367:62-703(+)